MSRPSAPHPGDTPPGAVPACSLRRPRARASIGVAQGPAAAVAAARPCAAAALALLWLCSGLAPPQLCLRSACALALLCLRAAQPSAHRLRSTNKDSYRDPNLKAALVPYHPNAPRSRLPVHFQDEAKPFRRFCKPRNEHSYECASFTHYMAILAVAMLTMAVLTTGLTQLIRMRPSPPRACLPSGEPGQPRAAPAPHRAAPAPHLRRAMPHLRMHLHRCRTSRA